MKRYALCLVILGSLLSSCSKNERENVQGIPFQNVPSSAPLLQNGSQSKAVQIANIQSTGDALKVMFFQLEEVFAVTDPGVISTLKAAFTAHQTVQITFNPWTAMVTAATPETTSGSDKKLNQASGLPVYLNHNMRFEYLDGGSSLFAQGPSAPGLTNVVPDMATAQLMFDFLANQCCSVGAPFDIDLCIPFQYCIDGCYARAHKMCWVINNIYHYDTHKIFSFANAGSDVLSVQGQKWGGCCINWWYHVAPLVSIKTPLGTKAYVFDPAMFNQPVLLSVWLKAQENDLCSGSAHVSMINVQPTSSYAPASFTGTTFSTDPDYSSTNSMLTSYGPLTTCF